MAAPAADPEVRIGLVVEGARATLGGGGALRVSDPDEGPLLDIPAQSTVDVVSQPSAVGLTGVRPTIVRPRLLIEPVDSGTPVRVNGRDYRGTVEVRRGVTGIVVINRLGLEAYVTGVVGSRDGPTRTG